MRTLMRTHAVAQGLVAAYHSQAMCLWWLKQDKGSICPKLAQQTFSLVQYSCQPPVSHRDSYCSVTSAVPIRFVTVTVQERLQMPEGGTAGGSGNGGGGGQQHLPNSVQLDWWLWEKGEEDRDQSSHQHHRVLSVYY